MNLRPDSLILHNYSNMENKKIISLNSMQAIKKSDIEGGISYLSVMEDNLDKLIEGLNG